jgi:hypothetical protein
MSGAGRLGQSTSDEALVFSAGDGGGGDGPHAPIGRMHATLNIGAEGGNDGEMLAAPSGSDDGADDRQRYVGSVVAAVVDGGDSKDVVDDDVDDDDDDDENQDDCESVHVDVDNNNDEDDDDDDEDNGNLTTRTMIASTTDAEWMRRSEKTVSLWSVRVSAWWEA